MASKFNSTQIMVIARIWELWIPRTTNNSHMIAVEKNYEIITSTLPIPQPVLEKQLEPCWSTASLCGGEKPLTPYGVACLAQ